MSRAAPMYRPEPGDRVIDRHRILLPGEPETNRHGTVRRVSFLDIRVRWDDGDESSVGPFVLVPEGETEDRADVSGAARAG